MPLGRGAEDGVRGVDGHDLAVEVGAGLGAGRGWGGAEGGAGADAGAQGEEGGEEDEGALFGWGWHAPLSRE